MDLEEFILSIFSFAGSINFNIFGMVLAIILIMFWLIMIGWVWIDSGERTSKGLARFGYLLLILFLNIPGLIIYLIVRPSETIEEIYWADLERRYLKYETAELGDCPKCGYQLLPGFVFCTNCGHRIKRKCPKCGVLVNKDHKYCEFCGIQIRTRVATKEKYPDVEVMEKQIKATKEHATETVESKRTRYKTGQSFVVKLGQAILGIFSKAKDKAKEVLKLEKKEPAEKEKKKKERGTKEEKTKQEHVERKKEKDNQNMKKHTKKAKEKLKGKQQKKPDKGKKKEE